MGLFDLENKDVKYDSKRIRANAVVEGNIVHIDGKGYALVLNVHKEDIVLADEAASALLNEIKAHGADDKVSPGFDEVVVIDVAIADFDAEGKMLLTKETLRFPEWGYVHIYV